MVFTIQFYKAKFCHSAWAEVQKIEVMQSRKAKKVGEQMKGEPMVEVLMSDDSKIYYRVNSQDMRNDLSTVLNKYSMK